MSSYYQRRTSMSRSQNDGVTKKVVCTELTEYYRLDGGQLTTVSVYEDGLAYTSPAAPLTVPVTAVRSTAKAFATALAKADQREAQKKSTRAAEKAAKKLLAGKKRPEIAELLEEVAEQADASPAPRPAAPKPVTGQALSPEELDRRQRLWKESAEALLPYMSAEGQERARAEWQKLDMPQPVLVMPRPVAPLLVATTTPARPAGGLLDDITVLDLEFNGDHIIQLAAIRYHQLQPVDQLKTLVYFDGQLLPKVRELTNINPFFLRQAPKEKEVLRQFFALAGDSLLVAHNALAADRRVLEAARTRWGATAPLPNAWLCTMKLARARRPKQPAGLAACCQHFGIPTHGAHDALRDVQMCFLVLKCFHQQQPVTVAELAYGGPVAAPTLFAQAA